MVRKGFGNEPLKDLTMERKGVEEFEESLKIVDDLILFSLSKFSLEALSKSWV